VPRSEDSSTSPWYDHCWPALTSDSSSRSAVIAQYCSRARRAARASAGLESGSLLACAHAGNYQRTAASMAGSSTGSTPTTRCRRRTSKRTSARDRRTPRGSHLRILACSARTGHTRRRARASATRGASSGSATRARTRSGAAHTWLRREGGWTASRRSHRRRRTNRRRGPRSRPTRPSTRRTDFPSLSPRSTLSCDNIISWIQALELSKP
jgi:hypothetical protein